MYGYVCLNESQYEDNLIENTRLYKFKVCLYKFNYICYSFIRSSKGLRSGLVNVHGRKVWGTMSVFYVYGCQLGSHVYHHLVAYMPTAESQFPRWIVEM